MSQAENRAMFRHIARHYDTTNKILSLGLDGYWRRRAISALSPRIHANYLDIGSGTGDVALAIAEEVLGCSVIGIDASMEMLEVGVGKAAARKLTEQLTFLPSNILDLPFADNSFDGAITSFCIRNVVDRRRALRETARVLKHGASLIVCELTEPRGPVMGPLFRFYSHVFMPVITRVLSSAAAYRYLADSMADFPVGEEFLRIMAESGFTKGTYKRVTGGIVTLYAARVDK